MGGKVNPYESPGASPPQKVTAERLPLGKLLLGLALLPIVTALAFALLWPIHALIKYAVGVLLHGADAVIFGTTIQMFRMRAINAAYFGGLNALLFGLPWVLMTWRRRRLRPNGVLVGGLILASGWMVLLVGIPLTVHFQNGSEDSVLSGPNPVLNVFLIAMEFVFTGPLPLLVAMAAYAWWVRRLARGVSVGPSGEA